jgi:hypothetical protein
MGWPKWVAELADDKLFQSVAGISSVLALLMTLRVWWIARRISEGIAARVRLPALGKALESDLSELNRLNMSNAPAHDIAACLAKCRSRLRSMRQYRSELGNRRFLRAKIALARLLAFWNAESFVHRISRAAYGELLEVVLELEEFSARIPLRGPNG